MSPVKLISIVVLVVVGAHLLLFGFLRRRIAEATREHERKSREKDEPSPGLSSGNAGDDQSDRL